MSDTSPVLIDHPEPRELLARVSPANQTLLEQHGLVNITLVELPHGSELYELLCAHLVQQPGAKKSYSLSIGRGGNDDEAGKRTVRPTLGLGLHRFTEDGREYFGLLQTLGEPVGSDCGATLLRSLVLISPRENDVESLRALCERLVRDADKVNPALFTVYRWHLQYQRWMRGQQTRARSIESVVLPRKTQ